MSSLDNRQSFSFYDLNMDGALKARLLNPWQVLTPGLVLVQERDRARLDAISEPSAVAFYEHQASPNSSFHRPSRRVEREGIILLIKKYPSCSFEHAHEATRATEKNFVLLASPTPNRRRAEAVQLRVS